MLDLEDPQAPFEMARISGQDGSLYDGVVSAANGNAVTSTRVKAAMETQEPEGLFTGSVVPGNELAKVEMLKAQQYVDITAAIQSTGGLHGTK